MLHKKERWMDDVPGSAFWTSSLAVVYIGISITALYRSPPALRGISCHGEIILVFCFTTTWTTPTTTIIDVSYTPDDLSAMGKGGGGLCSYLYLEFVCAKLPLTRSARTQWRLDERPTPRDPPLSIYVLVVVHDNLPARWHLSKGRQQE